MHKGVLISPVSLSHVHTQVSISIPDIMVAPGTFEDIKNSNMRKIIARRLAESKASVPHSYQTVDCGKSVSLFSIRPHLA